VSGRQHGLKDSRDGFPAFISAVRQVRPHLFLFENVPGLFRRNRPYLNEIIAELSLLGYTTSAQILDASHHGVPQKRKRLFVVGHRATGGSKFQFPTSTTNPTTVGQALGALATSIPENAKWLTPSMDQYIAAYEEKSKCVRPRDLHLDAPARTLTCRNLAGATSDMLRIRLPDGRRRRITVREAARLQSFPDWFHFHGTESQAFYQIGNAVPPLLALAMAEAVRDHLDSNT
jgi:DNA (cytosine-5)-methyltransferase 1